MKEPKINVGIMGAPEVEFAFIGGPFVKARYVDGMVELDGCLYDEVCPAPCVGGACFELRDVAMGIGFHWERRETQRFSGGLRLIPDRGRGYVVAVNVVGIEEYLKSVISSEMSAGSSAALLRSHAVVSRSWLLRQLADRGKHTCAQATEWRRAEVDGETVDELVRWYDREDHTLFDVCADDHCQRYQGVTRQTSPAVAEAVEATRGMALTYGGEVCDARFSKCCGGMSETFGSCWEDAPHPYLEPVADTDASGRCFCDTHDMAVLESVLNGYDRESVDFYRWEVTYGADELAQLLRSRSGFDFGDIMELRPLRRGASGRITRLLVRGTCRSMIVGKELEIRRWLSASHLRSSAFDVERTPEGAFLLRGRGWGHGVGMCQIGAAVMGAEGYSWREILKHYFPKATLERIYE